MKKALIVTMTVLLAAAMTGTAKNAKPLLKKVTYCTTLDCEDCARKIRENISFEKGVKDLKVEVQTRMVEIKFDSNKTDTLKLKKAINKLGYEARVVNFD